MEGPVLLLAFCGAISCGMTAYAYFGFRGVADYTIGGDHVDELVYSVLGERGTAKGL